MEEKAIQELAAKVAMLQETIGPRSVCRSEEKVAKASSQRTVYQQLECCFKQASVQEELINILREKLGTVLKKDEQKLGVGIASVDDDAPLVIALLELENKISLNNSNINELISRVQLS